jgi:hypothetical protein
MYYLNCVFSAIEYRDQDVQKYRDYHNWSLLNKTDKRALFFYAKVLSPDIFDNQVFFRSDELCGDSGNKFYEFSQVRHQLLAVQSIVVAGQTRHVKKIMTYRMSWMQKNYYEPIQRFEYYLEQQRQQAAAARAAQLTYIYSNPASEACVIS